MNMFVIHGQCTHQICYAYLYRSGYDMWRPVYITIRGNNTKPVSFYFGMFIAEGGWYGFNRCSHAVRGYSSEWGWSLIVAFAVLSWQWLVWEKIQQVSSLEVFHERFLSKNEEGYPMFGLMMEKDRTVRS
ncbi:hypothetical protein DM860_010142 [Cuscuta australis]|uniref:Uncharacterized protein n=1 Tax=Cuscuta australis TaxID=267555 RepID=A0A328DA73_9ASTE|nr:hypothetical protein DM860_010142 [Cuscuta australis]